MFRYVEGFVSPVPKKKLSAYRAIHTTGLLDATLFERQE